MLIERETRGENPECTECPAVGSASYAHLSIGDVVGCRDDRGGIFTPGPARWHALRVRPQREDEAEAWLSRRGVYGFHPVVMRRVIRAGRVREYARRYLPGYVFARFPGDPLVHAVMACPFIMGALTLQGADGEWGILEPHKLRAIHSMRKIDAQGLAAREAERARRKARAALRPGDRVMFKAGALAGLPAEVVELRAGGGARVSLNLFGREALVVVGSIDLVRKQKRG